MPEDIYFLGKFGLQWAIWRTLGRGQFCLVASNLLKRMINQGGSKVKLLQQVSKAVQRHPNAFKTFSKKAKEIVSDLSD